MIIHYIVNPSSSGAADRRRRELEIGARHVGICATCHRILHIKCNEYQVYGLWGGRGNMYIIFRYS